MRCFKRLFYFCYIIDKKTYKNQMKLSPLHKNNYSRVLKKFFL